MLISKEGRVCLADFGLAKRIEADDSQQQEGEMDVAGTPYWCKPATGLYHE
jgi:serine/threonine protein kinase